jgi:hypothetical protein
MRQPPRIASALLRYLGPVDAGSVGDLLEEFQSGKSAGWYRRQVASVICSSMLRELRIHPVAFVACIAVGWFAEAVAPSALNSTIGHAVIAHDRAYFANGGLPPPPSAHFIWIYNLAVSMTGYAVGGFTAARTYRGHKRMMALMFATAIISQQVLLVLSSSVVIDASSMPPIYAVELHPLSTVMRSLVIPPVLAVIGGIVGSRRYLLPS